VTEEKRELVAAMLGHDGWQGNNNVDSIIMPYTLVFPKPARPVGLVLLVLQSLLYEAVPASLLEQSTSLQPGRMYTICKCPGLVIESKLLLGSHFVQET
jgi:hypothetical protein